jgi:uncharacterized protein with HEPN domain
MSNEFLDYVEDIIDWDVVKQEIPKIGPHLQQILQDYEDE